MISTLRGTIAALDCESVTLEVGGVGLRVLTTAQVISESRIGDTALLHTSLVVREDSLTLFGFSGVDDRVVFDKLQSVSGVGPRTALAALNVYPAAELFDVIQRSDEKALTAIPGIGRKGAQRLLLELTDKLVLTDTSVKPGALTPTRTHPWQEQVTQGLISLGWSNKEAALAVDQVAADAPIDLSENRTDQEVVAEMLAKALRLMRSP